MTREAWGKYDKEEDRFHPLSHHYMDDSHNRLLEKHLSSRDGA